jgi:BASS family bile acid:Na+ symporter
MDNISTLILALSLFIIMLGMGLALEVDDFARIFKKPRAIFTGLVNQLIFLPLLGFLIVSLLPVRPEIAVGVIILAACPGGPTSNLIAHLAKGDLALSVSLTAICSFITLLTIPFIVNLGLQFILGKDTIIQLNIVQTIIQVFAIVIIPVLLGMWIRASKRSFAERMLRPVRIASAVVFVLVLVGVVLKEKNNIIPYFSEAGLIMLILNASTMLLGLVAARVMQLPFKQGVSISVESGIQNGTLAITIATVLLESTTYAIAPAVYSMIMFLTGGLFIGVALKMAR